MGLQPLVVESAFAVKRVDQDKHGGKSVFDRLPE